MAATTWTLLLLLLISSAFAQDLSMNEIIAAAMTSPNGFNLLFDEASGVVRVDMDMLYHKEDWDMMNALNDTTIGMPGKRQAIQDGAGGQRWTRQTVPYEIDTSAFSKGSDMQVLRDAMSDWMKYTCIQFREAQPSDTQKIKFVDGDGCASYVGMQKGKSQDVLLAGGCRYKGTVIHELGHALGLHHEQTRPDRDEYVTIHRQNIPDHLEYNFKKYSWSVIKDLNVPYDYASIMHYGGTYFAEDKSKLTIETKDPTAQKIIGNRKGLSFRDIKTVNLMYECNKPQGCSLRDDQCQGEGFVGKDCRCWCPAEVSDYGDPYVICSSSSGSGALNSGTGTNTGGNGGGTSSGSSGTNSGSQTTGCMDMNTNCVTWARRGECTTSQIYMSSYCKRSCGHCNPVGTNQEVARCEDLHNMCPYWSKKGYCNTYSSYSAYMRESCKASCGLCSRYNSAYPAFDSNCLDINQYCSVWASQNYCQNLLYYTYMSQNCRLSCRRCGTQSDFNNYSG